MSRPAAGQAAARPADVECMQLLAGTLATALLAPAGPGGGGVGGGWPLAAAGVLLALVATGVVAVRRRRRGRPGESSGAAPPPPAATDPGVPPTPPTSPTSSPADLVLEASRWMTEAMDASLVRAITVSTAVDLLGGDDGSFVEGRRAAARWVPTVPAWGSGTPLGDAIVSRALETAQRGAHVTTAQGGSAWAVAAAPVLVDGTVIGAVVVAREGDTPFTPEEVARLDLLTPVAGSALGAADAHLRTVAAAEHDELTGLCNRRRLEADLAALVDGERVAFAMIDVDHFKHFNDANGHRGGDVALRLVAGVLRETLRPTDDAYRYGGEEFSVLLHGCDGAEALRVMERVRAAVRSLDVPGGAAQPGGCLTVSVGIAAMGPGRVRELVERADAALYRAKRAGRDRVVVADGGLAVEV